MAWFFGPFYYTLELIENGKSLYLHYHNSNKNEFDFTLSIGNIYNNEVFFYPHEEINNNHEEKDVSINIHDF